MLAVLLLSMAVFQPMATTAQAEIDAATVQRSIDRGVAYLRKSQTERGGWNEFGGQSCGLTALCTLAWVNSGVDRNDADFAKAMRYLRTFEPKQTYSAALQTLVFCQVGALEDLPRIRRNVKWICDQQKKGNARYAGAWDYGNGRGNGDPSNSQFALLALGAAVERGVEVDQQVFQAATEYWRKIQLRRGGWSYGGPDASGSMTCAGIASLIISQGSLRDFESKAKVLNCCGGDDGDEAIERGMKFLEQIFTVRANPGGQLLSYFYYLYAVERVGRLSGRRLIGGRDWYREGAERLVGLQDGFQGFWQGGGVVEQNRDVATSFALLFLAKGKRQIVISQLDHPTLRSSRQQRAAGNPNVVARKAGAANDPAESLHHADGLRQLVRQVERDWSKDLTWQVIGAEQAGLEDLLQSPVIVIAGQSKIQFNAELSEQLKTYLDQGGTILFDAQSGDGCGDASAFQTSVLELCRQWYPGATLDRLPASHPVWFAQRAVDPKSLGNDFWMYGLGACCRTPVFYAPKSLTCRWAHGGPLYRGAELPKGLRDEVTTGISIGENILAYATGRQLKDKLQQSTIVDGSEAPPPTRNATQLAVAALGAGERQVPRALPNAAAIIRQGLDVEVVAIAEPIELTDESLARVGVLYLHGQTDFQLSPEQRKALANYLERGGFLIASPICGSEAFATAMRRELLEVVPDRQGKSFEPMPKTHTAFTRSFGGYDLSNVEIRLPSQSGGTASAESTDGTVLSEPTQVGANSPLRISRRKGTPQIESLSIDGVESVFLSPLDLSCALESQNSIQCPGYATGDAAKILAGLILYCLNQ